MARYSDSRQAGAASVVPFSLRYLRQGISDVQKVDLFAIYELGSEVRHFLALEGDNVSVRDLFFPLIQAIGAFRKLRGANAPVVLDIALGPADAAYQALDALNRQYFYSDDGKFTFPDDPEKKVASWEFVSVQTTIRNFEAVFKAESQGSATYRVEKKGTYNTSGLVDRASDTLAPDVRAFVGQQCLDEYQAAGRCFAFGLHTAAGYHACRATEAVLRRYYQFFIGADDAQKNTWGDLIGPLEKLLEGGGSFRIPDKKTISHLKHMKDFDRNPLSHLRSVLDESGADIVLNYAKVSITVMAQEILKIGEAEEPVLKLEVVEDGKEVA